MSPENPLSPLMNFYVKLKLIYQGLYFINYCFKIKNADLAEICANVNIDFQIPHALSFPKMYRFTNPHKIYTKVHLTRMFF